jgi:transcription initiation factor TFIIF subunit beta
MNGIKSDPDVKMDSDVNTPPGSGYMDDDFYEDTGELSIPPKDSEKDVWLTRIPKWLYDAVSNWDDLADGADTDRIVLGEVMAVRDQTGQGLISKDHPMRLFLNPQWQSKSQLPQAYELMPPPPAKVKTPAEAKKAHDEAAASLGHTYIFAEKDLPGYKPSDIGHHRMGGSGNMGVQDPKARIQKRGRYKKAIPSTLVWQLALSRFANIEQNRPL